MDLEEQSSVPTDLLQFTRGVPLDVCLLSKLLNCQGDVAFLKQLASNSTRGSASAIAGIMNAQLDCLSKHLLQQLCLVKRELPVHDPTMFEKLIKFGLVTSRLVSGYMYLTVAQGVYHMCDRIVQCDVDHDVDNVRRFSATELWKALLSPRTRELLLDCQSKGWLFVPELWYFISRLCLWFQDSLDIQREAILFVVYRFMFRVFVILGTAWKMSAVQTSTTSMIF